MSRYFTRKGPIDCFYVDDCDGKPVAVVSVVHHNLEALTIAYHLNEAAAWFQAIARGEVEPTPTRRMKPAPDKAQHAAP